MKVRRSRIRITKKGVRVTPPSVRLGGNVGVNISRSGVSRSVRTRFGTYNSKRGCTLPGCLVPLLMVVLALGLLARR